MSMITYSGWAILPATNDPLVDRAHAMNPPMMVTIALDPGSSLVVELNSPPTSFRTMVTTTFLSGEGQPEQLFRVFGASGGGDFSPLETSPWDMTAIELEAEFCSTITAGGANTIKFVPQGATPLVVNTIRFELIE